MWPPFALPNWGLRVALVEETHLSGVCLNWGYIPTKSLLRNAEVISLLGRGKEFGFSLEGFRADYGAAVDRSRKVSARLVKGVGALMRKNKVTVIEMLPRVLPLEDAEVGAVVERAFKRRRIKLLTAIRLEALEMTDHGVQVRIFGKKGEQRVEAERVLIAVGVRPNSEGLEAVGVQTEREYVLVDEQMRTNIPGVYTIGDLTGKMALAHVASAQGIVAVESIAGRETARLDYAMMPRCTYCQPQVASFGLTEDQAVRHGQEIRVGRFPFLANGKALGLGEREGFVKIIADAHSGEILGAHLVGPEVTELLPELILARSKGLAPNEIAHGVHAHPTVSEALMEAVHDVFGQALHL